MLSRSQLIGMSPGRWRLTQSYACKVYASTGASQYSQRAMAELGWSGFDVIGAHRAREDRRGRVQLANVGGCLRHEGHQRLGLTRRVQLVAQLPGIHDISSVVRLDGRDQVVRELVVRAAPRRRVEGQQQLDVVVHPADAAGCFARHGRVVVDQRDDQTQVSRAQHRGDLGDPRSDARTVPGADATAVGGEDANDARHPASARKLRSSPMSRVSGWNNMPCMLSSR